MELIRYQVDGISALLMHNPAAMAQRSTGLGRKTIPTPAEEAEASAYRMEDGQLYIPTTGIRAAMIDGLAGRRIGKLAAGRVLGSSLFVLDERTPLVDRASHRPLHDYEIDVRRVVVQKQGVLRARARINDWSCQVVFEYEPDFLSPAIVTEALNLGGKLVGVGDYRPKCPVGKGGPFGRFTAALLP